MTVAQLAEERRNRRGVFWLLLALVTLVIVAVVWGVPHIERSRTDAVEAVLADNGWDTIDVSFSGRDATVEGVLPPGVAAETVVERVAGIMGVRVVHSTFAQSSSDVPSPTVVTVVTVDPEPDLFISVVGGRATLRGLLPSDASIDSAVGVARAAFGEGAVTSELQVGQVTSPTWLNSLWSGFSSFAGFGDFELTINGGQAVLGGAVEDEAAKSAIYSGLQAAVGSELEVVDNMEIAPADDPTVLVGLADGTITVAGIVATPEDINAANTALQQRFGGAVVNSLGLGRVTSPDWLGSLWDAFAFLPRNGSYAVELVDKTLTLRGDVASETIAIEVGSALGAVLPADFAVENRLQASRAVAADACPVGELNDLLDVGVLFGHASADLQESALAQLDPVVDVLLACEGVPVEIGGHTDSSGSDELNLELSQARADAVREYLVGRGIPEHQLTAVGYGESQPVASNDTAAGQAANRRIEFTLGGN